MSKMKKYKVRCGPAWEAVIMADDPQQAAVKAIKRDMPNDLGMLVEIECAGVSVWWDVREALKKAGVAYDAA